MSDYPDRALPPDTTSDSPVEGELDGLTSREYQELRALAHTLRKHAASFRAVPGTDSLVHEMYLSLKNAGQESWHDRTHFISVAVLQLRHLLVDHARATLTRKRGGDKVLISFDEGSNHAPHSPLDVLILDEALQRLELHDARQHRVAELRLFGGLSVAEVGSILEVSERTVKGDWRRAREFLASELRSDSRADP